MVAVEMWADLAVGGVGHCRLTGVGAVGTVGLLSGSCRDGLSSCRAGGAGGGSQLGGPQRTTFKSHGGPPSSLGAREGL